MGRNRYNKRSKPESIKNDFLNYVDTNTNKIEIEGMEKMGKTLEIDIYTDIFITYFFFRCDCKNMESVSETEYLQGLEYFNCNTLEEVKNQINYVREDLLDFQSNEFKEFYKFLFTFNASKILSIDIIEVYFQNLFYNKYPITKEFIQFLKETKQGLNKDQWECFLDFILYEGNEFPKNYDCGSFYPLIYDKFYEWYCDLHKIPREKNEDDEC